MTVHGEIVPRPDASPEQCKALAAALERWFAACLAELGRQDADVDGWLDLASLDDLRAGELPQPAVLRLLGGQPGLNAKALRAALDEARAPSDQQKGISNSSLMGKSNRRLTVPVLPPVGAYLTLAGDAALAVSLSSPPRLW